MGGTVNSIGRGLSNATGIKGLGETIIDPFDLTGGKAGAASEAALGAQTSATGRANQFLSSAYGNQKEFLSPYADAGKVALGNLTNKDYMTQDPGYQFRLNEGNKAINASMAARGLSGSGAALKALTRYGQDYATQDYQNNFNRQMQIANMGQESATNLSGAAGTLGSNLSNNTTGLGNAQASQIIGANNARQQNMNQMLSMGTALFSDERLKTNIAPVDQKDLEEMKEHLKAIAFNYLNDIHGKGDWIGVFAQDLEKSKLGRTLVVTDENGNKTINQNKVLSMFLATLAKAA